MNILLATSEAVPFAKTGGLADVCGALPLALAELGHHVSVVLPAYRQTRYCGQRIEPLGIDFIIPIGSKMVTGHLLRSTMPGGRVPVYLVEQDQYYDRDELYNVDGKDYVDNCERFVFFSRAVLEAIRLLDLPVDVLHVNDWQTGLVPAYLKIEYHNVPRYENIAALLTVHNLSYQGQFWHWDMLLTGLDWKYFNWHQMEFHGNLNLLKTGMVFSDSINTVSPRYAQEIQSSPLGCGLEGVLQHRHDVLSGILNGIDPQEWNPETDPHLTAHYNAATVDQGKPLCKKALQQELGLPQEPGAPLIGIVGRLIDQKGFDLVAEVMQRWVQTSDVQWAILGTGQPQYHQLLETLAQRFPQRVALRLGFSNPLAHQIEAGADLFLMPSRFEPCGLNQLYSLRYGTVPLVRATGGLADTITGFDAQSPNPAANGFVFYEPSALALGECLRQACDAYRRPEIWKKLIQVGMHQDWSWSRSAREYVALYQKTMERAKKPQPAG
ncbi:MAG: glycogen synthase GlgA [Planctomycetaceae bacterium]|nr:glycogen synthase GlgA [Planctomycetaceae bacterium]